MASVTTLIHQLLQSVFHTVSKILLYSISYKLVNTDLSMSIYENLFYFISALPVAPSQPWVSAVTKESITVNWKEPSSDGGSHVFGYHLQMKDRNSILWQKVNTTVIRATHFKVSNVNAGLIYEFKVAAENAAGIGPVSKSSDPVLAIDACGKHLVFCKLIVTCA